MGWAATYGGSGNDHASSIQQTLDGGYVVAGETESFGAGNYDLWVLKLKPDGAVEWQKTYGGSGWDNAESIQQTSDGGYIVAGWTESFGAGQKDVWVLKIGPDDPLHPYYGFIGRTNASSIDSNATVLDTTAVVRDSKASLQDSSATIQDTTISAAFLVK